MRPSERIAGIILNGKETIVTDCGRKTKAGIADLIERETGTADLLDMLKRVERWMSGYGTLKQSEMRELVRTAIIFSIHS